MILHAVERDIILRRLTCFLGRSQLLSACSDRYLQSVPPFGLFRRKALILAYCLDKGCTERLLFMSSYSRHHPESQTSFGLKYGKLMQRAVAKHHIRRNAPLGSQLRAQLT